MWIVGFLLVLGPLVTLHELGHYLVARWFGVKAEAFSIGFGKEMFGWTDKHGTRWKLSMLPLGGYVQFKGDMNPASIPDAQQMASVSKEERDGSFQYAALWKRALIVFAGPAANLLITIAIFAAFNMIYGTIEASSKIGGFSDDSPAAAAGLLVDDRIVAIDGRSMDGFQDVSQTVMMYPGRTVDVTVERGGRDITMPVTLASVTEKDRFGNESRIGRIGIYAAAPRAVPVGPGESLVLAVDQTGSIMRMMITGIAQIFTGERSVKELGGPIKIAKYSGEQLSLGPLAFVNFVALISINLAFINLLPIPALDGGHLAFYAAEAIRRKPVGLRGQEMAYRTGVAFVLALMLFVTIQDLVTLPLFGG
ncbi:MAG: RIP metalloprotease RseP [Sphingomonadaceae bacterium]